MNKEQLEFERYRAESLDDMIVMPWWMVAVIWAAIIGVAAKILMGRL